jgi:hypothetical protein
MLEEKESIKMPRVYIVTALFALLAFAQTPSPKQVHADEALYNNIGTVEGTVTMLNHEELGKAPFNGATLLFQRADFPDAVVVVHADLYGHYAISLSKGRYRVIMRQGTREGETKDILAPAQPRFFEIRGPVDKTVFNIDVLFPK